MGDLEPAGHAFADHVVEPPVFGLDQRLDVGGEVHGVGGRAELVAHHVELGLARLDLLHDLLDELLVLARSAAHHPAGATDQMPTRVLGHIQLAGIFRARIVPERIGQIPVIEAVFRAVDDAGGADVEQRNIKSVGNPDRVLDRGGVGEISVFDMLLAILEIGMRAKMEQVVGSKRFDILAIAVEVAKIEQIEPGLVHILVGASQLIVAAEDLVKGLSEHAAASGQIDLSQGRPPCFFAVQVGAAAQANRSGEPLRQTAQTSVSLGLYTPKIRKPRSLAGA